MTSFLLAALGIASLLTAAVDAFWTTLWVDATPAPVSNALASAIWKGTRRLFPSGRRRLRSLAGPISLLAILVLWIVLVWAGWTLLLSADPHSLVSTRQAKPVDLAGRIYFVAYTMFTMGNGDYYPAGDGWELITSLMTASGMVVVTLAISYTLSVLPAIVQSRTMASEIHGLGKDAETFLLSFWNGETFPQLEMQLNALAAEVTRNAQQHNAYPILHVYRGSQRPAARGPAIAILDEALTLLHFGLAETVPLAPGVIMGARTAVRTYLDTLRAVGIAPAGDTPPAPDLSRLRAHGIPTVTDETFAARLAGVAERRRLLLGLVHHDGYDWPNSR